VFVQPVECCPLPDRETLHKLELLSRQQGSGVEWADLIGRWRVRDVWGKTNKQSSSVSSLALRSLAAMLTIQQGEKGELALENTISLGLFKLCFFGPGQLKQKRPLLLFHFNEMRLFFAGKLIWSLPLRPPAKRQEPFFALIARKDTEQGLAWLAARGRGGGLALWVREDEGQDFGDGGVGENLCTEPSENV
jgi:hypothetical protein